MRTKGVAPYLDERVLWLDIAVEEAVFVHESDRLHHLEHDVANLGLRERPTSLERSRGQEIQTDERKTPLRGSHACGVEKEA